MQELQKNFSQEKINALCVREGQNIRVLCFQSADSLSTFADKFYIMTQSDLFLTQWRGAMDKAFRGSAGASLTLADIFPKVWLPAFRNCQSLLQELHNHSLNLGQIDKFFKRHEHDLEMQLMDLFKDVNACLGVTKSGAWIAGVVCRIHDYWHFCNYRKAANALLELKKALNLQKGDFSDVETLATKVRSKCRQDTISILSMKFCYFHAYIDINFHEGPDTCSSQPGTS